MTKLSKEGRQALTDLHTGTPVQVFPDTVAKPLIEAGYARKASVDPVPERGTALNITSAGRGALLNKDGELPPTQEGANTVAP